jgi:hypothetical protein
MRHRIVYYSRPRRQHNHWRNFAIAVSIAIMLLAAFGKNECPPQITVPQRFHQ